MLGDCLLPFLLRHALWLSILLLLVHAGDWKTLSEAPRQELSTLGSQTSWGGGPFLRKTPTSIPLYSHLILLSLSQTRICVSSGAAKSA